MNLLDRFLEEHGLTRYQLSQFSGIGQSTWKTVNDKSFEQYTGKQLLAIANAVGKSVGEVANQLLQIELEDDNLNGLKKILDKYDYVNIAKELKVKSLLFDLKNHGVEVQPFTFNRLDGEEDIDVEAVIDNTITALSTALANVQAGNPPFPEEI